MTAIDDNEIVGPAAPPAPDHWVLHLQASSPSGFLECFGAGQHLGSQDFRCDLEDPTPGCSCSAAGNACRAKGNLVFSSAAFSATAASFPLAAPFAPALSTFASSISSSSSSSSSSSISSSLLPGLPAITRAGAFAASAPFGLPGAAGFLGARLLVQLPKLLHRHVLHGAEVSLQFVDLCPLLLQAAPACLLLLLLLSSQSTLH